MSQNIPTHVQHLLEDRYFQPHETTWTETVNRVVDFVYENDTNTEQKQRARELMHDRIFLPNSPTIVNADTPTAGLMACFVVPTPTDDLEYDLYDGTRKQMGLVAKHGGGAGFTVSTIRPEGAPVSGSAHGYAYGPCAFAELVSRDGDKITQTGFRKMALMCTMNCEHPDLEKFIDFKQTTDEDFCYNFNQSIMATNDWMEKQIRNPTILEKVAKNIKNNGEPGLLFDDQMNESWIMDGRELCPYSLTHQTIHATNPCGEVPLPEWGTCNLGSINISHSRYIDNGQFNTVRLKRDVETATRFLDNVGSMNDFPSDGFEDWYNENRPIGLGIMGFADACLKLGYTYGQSDSLDFLENVLETIYDTANRTSISLGKERGVPKKVQLAADNYEHFPERRNITLLSIAPTGSISMIADCSSGIEPVFAKKWNRTDENGNVYEYEHPMVDENHFRCAVSTDKSVVPTWQQHLDVQAAAQKYIDSGISKTINFPPDTHEKEILNGLIYAYESNLKGVTMYVTGSRNAEVLVAEEDIKSDCSDGECDIPL